MSAERIPTVAVIGHVQHVTLGGVPTLPRPGEIVRLGAAVVIAGAGGGVAFAQLTRSSGRVHLFTALGDDGTAAEMEVRLRATGAAVHVARRSVPHPRDVVLLTPDGERTIIVAGEPLHPRAEDALPWDLLASCDAVYFTSYDPALLPRARRARQLVVTARRREALIRSGVRADVVVGSANDAQEVSARADYPVPPAALVMTAGARGGRVETAAGTVAFEPTPAPAVIRSTYGAGDSFAAALTWYVGLGAPVLDACRRAAAHGAAVLASPDTLAVQRPLPASLEPLR